MGLKWSESMRWRRRGRSCCCCFPANNQKDALNLVICQFAVERSSAKLLRLSDLISTSLNSPLDFVLQTLLNETSRFGVFEVVLAVNVLIWCCCYRSLMAAMMMAMEMAIVIAFAVASAMAMEMLMVISSWNSDSLLCCAALLWYWYHVMWHDSLRTSKWSSILLDVS